MLNTIKKIILTASVIILSGCIESPPADYFKVENTDTYNKYTDIKQCQIKYNWVRADNDTKTPVAFDLVAGLSRKSNNSEYFLIIRRSEYSAFDIGDYLILDVEPKKHIKLKLDSFSFGSKLMLNSGWFSKASLMTSNQLSSLLNAKSIHFSLQGSQFSKIKELTGTFTQENMVNFGWFKKACKIKLP